MKFAFALPHMLELEAMMQPWELAVTGADQTRMARRAEQLGYDMIAIPEHFIMPREHVDLSGGHWLHSTIAQAYFAGATERITLNSCVTILPLQHPVITAKALATADWLSSGRMMVTFGVGWLKAEFDLLGVPFHRRGRIADEYLAAIIELWTADSPSFDGEFVSFSEVVFEPKPLQRPHLPVWIGGDADAALRRAARFASGWFTFLTKPEDIAARVEFIKSQPEFGDRPFDVMHGLGTNRVGEGHVATGDRSAWPGMSAEELIDRIGTLHEHGVTYTAVPIPPVRGVDEYLEYSEWIMTEVAPNVP